jgi:hypothetical protein
VPVTPVLGCDSSHPTQLAAALVAQQQPVAGELHHGEHANVVMWIRNPIHNTRRRPAHR